MKRLLVSAAVVSGLAMLPSAPAQAVGRSCAGYTIPTPNYSVRNMRVGGTTCGGGRGVIANWTQNCSAHHCIVGAYGCHARSLSRFGRVSRLYCFARGRFVIASVLRP